MGVTNIAAIVRQHGTERPDRVAIIHPARTITWAELDERSSRMAAGLAAAGVRAEDRVARIDKNTVEYYEILFGAAKLNAVTVDVNWRLAPPEMAQIVNDAQAKVLFVGPDFVSHLEKIEADLTTVERIVVCGESASHDAYEAWLMGHEPADPGVVAEPDDVCLQLYTSGTTGLPKGVMLTNRNLFTFIDEVAPTLGFSEDSVSIVVMPVFHIAGSGWSLVGMALAATSVLHSEVNPAAIVTALGEHGITHAFFVPAVLQFLLANPELASTDVTRLQLVAYGASPITEKILRGAMAAFGCHFVQLYGLTETTGAIVQLDAVDHDPDGRPELLRSCGKPYPWVQVRVVGEDGDDVADGGVGELWVKSVQVMKGYWNKPDETAAAITPDGWFRTGDAGYWKDGYLYLHDRVKDMIVSGGENVYPAEVENALMAHPDVADVGVVGIPDERWGEAVHAVVVKVVGADPSPQELIAFARERLAGFKCPKSVSFVDALPRNPSGKILKRELREPYWADRERRIN
ncbi:MAG TPA: long-chain-fatty-acid--CoA ligase [Acidimicrobiales bacterium]|nr:long-chain-fatty-acid--CoA ligase [Acidimicrobiales bacterium]